MTGRVDAKGAVEHRSGTSTGGKAWAFYQQTVSVTVGGHMFDVNFRSDNEPKGDLALCELDDVVKLKVANPRIYAGKVSFDAEA